MTTRITCMFPCLCAQGSSIAEYSLLAVKRDTCVLVCLYALRGFTRPSYISWGGVGWGGVFPSDFYLSLSELSLFVCLSVRLSGSVLNPDGGTARQHRRAACVPKWLQLCILALSLSHSRLPLSVQTPFRQRLLTKLRCLKSAW